MARIITKYESFDPAPFDRLRAGRTGSLRMTVVEIAGGDKWQQGLKAILSGFFYVHFPVNGYKIVYGF